MLLRSKKRAGRYTVGLVNPANDCFANSNLQALSALNDLYNYISALAIMVPPNLNISSATNTTSDNDRIQSPKAAYGNMDSPLELTLALGAIMKQLNEPIIHQKSISPWTFLKYIEKFYDSHISRTQHDAHELLHLILEALETEHERIEDYYKKVNQSHNNDSSNSSASRDNNGNGHSHNKDYSGPSIEIPKFPFKGNTTDKITCLKCGHSPPGAVSPFLVLSVMVPQQKAIKLTALLEMVARPEIIQDYGCTRCRINHVLQSKSSSLYDKEYLSELLQFKEAAKVDNNIDLPEELEVRLPKEVVSSISKGMEFKTLPDILAIHLSRSIYGGYGASRNSCKVDVSEFIELYEDPEPSNGSSPSSESSSPTGFAAAKETLLKSRKSKVVYRLMAMIRHKGTHYTGHYECYRRKEFEWWLDHLNSSVPASQGSGGSGSIISPTNSATPAATKPVDLSFSTTGSGTGSSEDTEGSDTAIEAIASNNGNLPFPIDFAASSKVSNKHKVDVVMSSSSSSLISLLVPQTAIAKEIPGRTASPGPVSAAVAATAAVGGRTGIAEKVKAVLGSDVYPPGVNEWWKISDEKVWECSTKEVLKEESGAYLLFYEKVKYKL